MGLDFLKPTGHLTLNGSMLDGAAWEILSRPEEWNSPACRRDWQGLVDNSDNLNLIYQSPDWFGHLQQTEEKRRLALAVCRDKSGRTIAVAPLRIARFPFRFHVRGRTFGTIPTLQLCFLGGGPLGPHDPSLLDGLLRAAMHVFPEVHGFAFNPVQAETPLWKYLHDSPLIQEDLFPCNYPKTLSSPAFYGGYTPFSDSYLRRRRCQGVSRSPFAPDLHRTLGPVQREEAVQLETAGAHSPRTRWG